MIDRVQLRDLVAPTSRVRELDLEHVDAVLHDENGQSIRSNNRGKAKIGRKLDAREQNVSWAVGAIVVAQYTDFVLRCAVVVRTAFVATGEIVVLEGNRAVDPTDGPSSSNEMREPIATESVDVSPSDSSR